jgi:hypothetical protein
VTAMPFLLVEEEEEVVVAVDVDNDKGSDRFSAEKIE